MSEHECSYCEDECYCPYCGRDTPKGYALVPIDPTQEQLFSTSFNLCNEFDSTFVEENKEFALAVYKYMTKAAQESK